MNKYNSDIFRNDLCELGIRLTEKQIEDFFIYYEMLIEWNSFMNLTAITDRDEVIKKHFVDSLTLIKAYNVSKDVTVIDVGTGAGFPGLALKIAFPNLKITLLDSLNKRIQFLDAVIEKLKLQEIQTIHGRAEDFAKKADFREKYDLCVSRAVANLSTLAEYCLPFVKINGQFISYKSEKLSEEKKAAENAISMLGGICQDQIELCLPNTDIYRNLFIIKKVKETPKKFPRKAGLPAKEPLS